MSIRYKPNLIRRKINGLIDGINHHEVIAQSMHFGKQDIHKANGYRLSVLFQDKLLQDSCFKTAYSVRLTLFSRRVQ